MAIDIDKLREDLHKKNTKDIIIDVAIEMKLMNGTLVNHGDKLRWHDKILLGIFSVIGLGVVSAIILGVINR